MGPSEVAERFKTKEESGLKTESAEAAEASRMGDRPQACYHSGLKLLWPGKRDHGAGSLWVLLASSHFTDVNEPGSHHPCPVHAKSETTNHERIKYIEPVTEFGTISLPFSKNGPHLQVFMQLNLLK